MIYQFDSTKAIQLILYILQRIGGKGDFIKIFKILYFADQKHLTRFGRAITNDNYVAMNHGPVPSNVYDIFKILKGQSLFNSMADAFTPYFKIENNHNVISLRDPELEDISDSERECLDEAISENKDLGFSELSAKSHDAAWKSDERNGEIATLKIAEAAGANPEMLKYIESKTEINRAFA
jgi:uncharacterized phage-associated protein